MQISVKQLCQQWKLNQQQEFQIFEVRKFLNTHQKILESNNKNLTQQLNQWSLDQFQTLLKMLCYVWKIDAFLTQTFPTQPAQSEKIESIYNSIFKENTTREIFHKFILPKSIQNTNVSYGHSDLQKHRYANLSMSFKEAFERLNLLGSNFTVGIDCSPERMRIQRKAAFEIMFTCYARNPWFEQELEEEHHLLANFDNTLRKDSEDGIDTEWWSVHHVLFWMCSGSDDYYVPLWFNPKSPNSFHCFIPSAIKILKSSLNIHKPS